MNWIYASFLFVGISGIIWHFNKYFAEIKEYIDNHNQIEGKIIFLNAFPLVSTSENGMAQFALGINIYNSSSRILSCIIDTEKTKITYNNTRKDNFSYTNTSWLAPPYHPSHVHTDYISFDLQDKNLIFNDVKINAEIYIKYGLSGQENCQFFHKIEGISVIFQKKESTEGMIA